MSENNQAVIDGIKMLSGGILLIGIIVFSISWNSIHDIFYDTFTDAEDGTFLFLMIIPTLIWLLSGISLFISGMIGLRSDLSSTS